MKVIIKCDTLLFIYNTFVGMFVVYVKRMYFIA